MKHLRRLALGFLIGVLVCLGIAAGQGLIMMGIQVFVYALYVLLALACAYSIGWCVEKLEKPE